MASNFFKSHKFCRNEPKSLLWCSGQRSISPRSYSGSLEPEIRFWVRSRSLKSREEQNGEQNELRRKAFPGRMLERGGRVDGQNPNRQTKNTYASINSIQFYFIYCVVYLRFFPPQTNAKEKDVPKPTTDLSEDLFKVHDFDVKIDLQVPSAGEDSPGLFVVRRRRS